MREDNGRPAQSTGGFIARYWRGEFPLALTFWVNLMPIIGLFNAYGRLDGTNAPAFLLVALLAAVVIPWQLVGIWRSARKYDIEHGPNSWGSMARAVVALYAILSIGVLAAGLMDIIGAPG